MTQKTQKTILSYSGGKDSTALLIEAQRRGLQLDEIIFADTGMEFPEMYQHISEVEDRLGVEITKIHAPLPWNYWMFEHQKKSGTVHVRGYGWPMTKLRWCTERMKNGPIQKYINAEYKDKPIQLIGYAFDELQRVKKPDPLKRYPLIEWRITEAEALQLCYKAGFTWGGLYKHFDRLSCWCCPFQPKKSLRNLYFFYPELWEKMKEFDARTANSIKDYSSVSQFEESFKAELQKAGLIQPE